jgi:murein DD-endopeptidase MepM/ murein hydrolase activator NlpD
VPTQAAKTAGAPVVHTVEKGETLYGIAKSYHVPLPELLAANRLRERDVLHIGQRLVVPQASVASGAASSNDAAGGITSGDGVSGEAGKGPASAAAGAGVALEWPVKGMLYAKFGKKGKEVHDGIDLAAPLGTPVKAAAAGKVLYAGEQKGYGRIVIIEHSAGVVTLYAHNHELRTQTGATVAAGAVIATVGKSGRTSGPHLHFELRKNGVPVDPLPYFKSPP